MTADSAARDRPDAQRLRPPDGRRRRRRRRDLGLTQSYPGDDPAGAPARGHGSRRRAVSRPLHPDAQATGRSSSPTRRSTSTRRPRSWRRSPTSTADAVRRFDVEPRVAMLSFSNFGSNTHANALKVRRAVELVRPRARISWSTARCRPTPPSSRRCWRPITPGPPSTEPQRPDLPGPAVGQYRLQAGLAAGRRRGDRADPARHAPGPRAPARRRRHRHREHGRHRGGRRPGEGGRISPRLPMRVAQMGGVGAGS